VVNLDRLVERPMDVLWTQCGDNNRPVAGQVLGLESNAGQLGYDRFQLLKAFVDIFLYSVTTACRAMMRMSCYLRHYPAVL
jgi:hypothetical protein